MILFGISATNYAEEPAKQSLNAAFKPKILISLPDEYNTPDGMRLDPKTGVMYIAFPNYNIPEHPGVLAKITKDNKLEKVCDLPKHPDTGVVRPMGLDIGPDGNIYVADNQYFESKEHKSRVLRVVMKDGEAVETQVAVDGFKLANAVMFWENEMFVSDTYFDREGKPGMSGVYRITMEEMGKSKITLMPSDGAGKDPHLVLLMYTKALMTKREYAGADGITFDGKGNLYVGSFGDGSVYRVMFGPDRKVIASRIIAYDSLFTCCDGLFYDKKRDCIYAADSEKNAIRVIWLPDFALSVLWRNNDTDGTDGLLDQPCETAIRGDQLIVCNFDMPFPGLKNTKFDKPCTISTIDLSTLKRP